MGIDAFVRVFEWWMVFVLLLSSISCFLTVTMNGICFYCYHIWGFRLTFRMKILDSTLDSLGRFVFLRWAIKVCGHHVKCNMYSTSPSHRINCPFTISDFIIDAKQKSSHLCTNILPSSCIYDMCMYDE